MILTGDALTILKTLDSGVVQTCITSPPYWSLRDYNVDGQLGLEPTPEEYIARLVEIFAEVKRVLRDDGTLWLNIGDSYTSGDRTWRDPDKKNPARAMKYRPPTPDGLKPKDLIGVPWKVAFALQADGWYLRSDIIWSKPNPMPESITDRPTSAHEHVFLLAKSQRYFYDADAIREPHLEISLNRIEYGLKHRHPDNVGIGIPPVDTDRMGERFCNPAGRNKRNVWTVATKPFSGAHFAVFPPALIEPCVLAGSADGDTVLDPFCGSGTTGEVAYKHRRKFIGIELNPEYVKLAEKRLREVEVVMF